MSNTRAALNFRAIRVKAPWQSFALKVGGWFLLAGGVGWCTTIFLESPPFYVIAGILSLGALQIGLLDRTPLPAGNGKMLKRGVALLMLAFAFWISGGANGASGIQWQTYSDEILEAARKGQRPVMIDFVRRDCPPCTDMERKVFTSARVKEAAKDFLTLRADLTDNNPANEALEKKFGIEGFPTIVFVGGDGKEHLNLRLIGYENARFFAERVESAR